MSSWPRTLTGAIAVTALLTVVLGLPSSSAPGGVANARVAAPLVAAPPDYQPASEMLFVPITPCRIVNTLNAGSRYADTTTRSYVVTGTSGFAAQGGKSTGCGIPKGATAIAATLTAHSNAGTGYVRAWPGGTSEPGATLLNYSGDTTSTGVTLAISTAAKQLTVKNYRGRTDIVIDVSGYYTKPLAAMISPSGGLYAGSSRAIGVTPLGDGYSFAVQFDRNVRNCIPTATVYEANRYASADGYNAGDDEVIVRVFDAAGLTVSAWVYLHVAC